MLNSRYLANMADDITFLYAQLENDIKKDMFRRLNKLRKVTDATVYQAEILQQVGGLKKDIEKLLVKYDDEIKKELTALFEEALEKATQNDLRYYSLGRRELSATQAQTMNASIDRFENAEVINKTYAARAAAQQQIYESLRRMTLTVADASCRQFMKEANAAYMKVSSGGFSWQSAYKTAVNNLARDGVKAVIKDNKPDYERPAVSYSGSGRTVNYSIEAAARMNIITGINQTAAQQTLENADNLGTDLVEVSAHIGARDRDVDDRPWANHSAIQGKVYCLNGERDFIDSEGNRHHAPNFQTACGLGEADGICGINCRHSYYPYFEGLPLQYSAGELDEMNEKKVTLDGKKMSPYEAEQDLRLCERNIRRYKTAAEGYELTGLTDQAEYIKIKNKIWEWQARARDIVDQTGLERKYINEYIGTKNGKQPTGWKPKK